MQETLKNTIHLSLLKRIVIFVTTANRPNKIDPERDYQILIQFIKYMEVRKSLVFREYKKCSCEIGFLVPTIDPSYLQCTYCDQKKVIVGFQESLKFDDNVEL
jgi:hypothetical protein